MKLVFFFIYALMGFTSSACVCSDFDFMPDFTEKFMDSSQYQMVAATIISIEEVNEPLYADTTGRTSYEQSLKRYYREIKLELIASTHQQQTSTLTIATGLNGGACGVTWFKKGRKYLITLGKNKDSKGRYWTSICVPNRQLNKSKEAIEFIKNKMGRFE